MLTFREFLIEKYGKAGTYAAMQFDMNSKLQIAAYMARNKIPNPLEPSKLHVTLLYSRKHMEGYVPRGKLETPLHAQVTGFDVWDTKDNAKALVARLYCPELVSRHKELMDTYKGTYDFDEYKPHFTLSYNVPTEFSAETLPPFGEPVFLANEYGNDLDTDWKAD